MSIPSSFRPAAWRGTLPPDAEGNAAFSLELADGSVLRLRLIAQHARDLRETLDPAYWSKSAAGSQSPKSREIASSPRSVPSDGVNT